MISIQTKSNKDVLAKLMATENINVIHKQTPTAYFDVKSRTLCCPILKTDMSPELTDLFMGHEVGHALNTPAEGWHDAVSDKGMTFKGYLNVIEDIRIEKKIKNKYPGLRKSFYAGYNELGKMDFFGLKERNQEVNELGFIDRINLHYKLGAQAQVKFSDEEMVYIKRCDSLESFEEVMELALELFETKQEETQTQLDSMTNEELQELMDKMDIDQDEGEDESDGDSMTVETEKSDEDSDQDASDAKSESAEDSEKSDEDSKSDETDGSGNGDQEEDTDQKDKTGGKSPKEQLKDEMNKSETDESFREKEDSLHKREHGYYNEPEFYDLPTTIKYDNFIVGYKKIQEQFEGEFNREYIKKYVKTFQDNNKKIVNYMVKEFEMKKAAAAYNRSYGAKSGELDMDKLAFYKLKDDIFNRVQVTPEGKNHGVVMAVDWSGSMSGSVRPTVEQAALLAMFCKRINIPFRVFAFSDSYDRGNGKFPDEVYHEKDKEKQKKMMSDYQTEKMFGKSQSSLPDFTDWDLHTVKLLEMLSDKMSNTDFTKALENWFQTAFSIDNYMSYYQNDDNANSKFDRTVHTTPGFALGGTPLDHTILIMRDYLTEFKAQLGIDIMSFIALTDGSSHSVFQRGNSSMVDRKYNKTIKFTGSCTSTLLKWLKDTAGVRTIGFYLTSSKGSSFKYDAAAFSGTKIDTWSEEMDKKKKEYTKISTSFDDGHYDLSIVINQKKLDINYDEDTLQVKDDATKGQLKNALVKAGNNKMRQRVILNQFVQQMAV